MLIALLLGIQDTFFCALFPTRHSHRLLINRLIIAEVPGKIKFFGTDGIYHGVWAFMDRRLSLKDAPV